MKKILIIVIVLLVAFCGWLCLRREKYIQINQQKIKVEVAESQEKIIQGLSGKESLCADCGMLFILPESEKHVFWMKEMKFDLDFVWIKGNRVVRIDENITHIKGEKEEIVAGVVANKVLEINAGKISQWRVKVGDEIIFDW